MGRAQARSVEAKPIILLRGIDGFREGALPILRLTDSHHGFLIAYQPRPSHRHRVRLMRPNDDVKDRTFDARD
jgi:hypothetical protein